VILCMGTRLIQSGDVDQVACTGAELTVSSIGLAAFCRMRALAKMWPADETKSIRPFDRDRSGTIFGDGAGCLILEGLDSAVKRGAKIYAEVAGFGLTDDAYHVTAPDPSGDGAFHCMKFALKNAGVAPDKIDYINAHGTGTPYNDVMETNAIKRVLGDRAYQIPVSSTKSMIGHCIGAAGAIEAIVTIKTINDGIVPPTINLENPDPECDLDYVPNVARKQAVRTAMSNNFGFGGHNASIIFKRFEG
ncbi:MAG: beta-ketoacyl-[acyl-carrier-protein] synthase family protein, partial [bacterium]